MLCILRAVAAEVGNLAKSTQQSFAEVKTVIERVQNNVKDINVQINENSSKLGTQNEYFINVFGSIQDMTELLNLSAGAINTMGEAHNKQAGVFGILSLPAKVRRPAEL